MTVDSDADPCELRLSDYRELAGRQVPHKVEVRQGADVVAVLEWSQIELSAAPEATP
jgi:hypothetical protein